MSSQNNRSLKEQLNESNDSECEIEDNLKYDKFTTNSLDYSIKNVFEESMGNESNQKQITSDYLIETNSFCQDGLIASNINYFSQNSNDNFIKSSRFDLNSLSTKQLNEQLMQMEPIEKKVKSINDLKSSNEIEPNIDLNKNDEMIEIEENKQLNILNDDINKKQVQETKRKTRNKDKEREYSQVRLEMRGYQQFYFFIYILLLGFKIEIRREKICQKCHYMRFLRIFQDHFFYFQDTDHYEYTLKQTNQTQKKGKDMYIFSCRTMALILETIGMFGFDIKKKGTNDTTFPVIKYIQYQGRTLGNKNIIYDIGKEFWTKIIFEKYGNENIFLLTIDDLNQHNQWSSQFNSLRKEIIDVYRSIGKRSMIQILTEIQFKTTQECNINYNMNYFSNSFDYDDYEYSCDEYNGVQLKKPTKYQIKYLFGGNNSMISEKSFDSSMRIAPKKRVNIQMNILTKGQIKPINEKMEIIQPFDETRKQNNDINFMEFNQIKDIENQQSVPFNVEQFDSQYISLK